MSTPLNPVFSCSKLQRLRPRLGGRTARQRNPLGTLLAVVCTGLVALPATALPSDKFLAQEQGLLPLPTAQSIPAKAQLVPLTPQVALERFFTTEPKSFRSEWFAPNFKVQGSNAEVASGVAAHIAQIKAQLGSYKGIEARGKEFVVALNRGSIPAKLELNPAGQITRLAFAKLEIPASSPKASLPSGKAYR
jgi:hypothetical protein